MDIVKSNYIEQQLFQVAPFPLTDDHFPYGFDIQIFGVGGRKTNCINITANQLKMIEEVLLRSYE